MLMEGIKYGTQTENFGTDYTKLTYGTSYDAWLSWCQKAIKALKRLRHEDAPDAGVKPYKKVKQPNKEAAESDIIRRIREALLADPAGRTTSVRDFKVNWRDDGVYVDCWVAGDNGSSALIGVMLS